LKRGDKVKVVVTWDTGELFGELKAEKEYEIGSSPARPYRESAEISAGEYAYRAKCLNNIKQLTVAMHQYAVDHNDMFPEKLSELYPRYAGAIELFQCPASNAPDIADADRIDAYTGYLHHRAKMSDGPSTPVLCDKPENHNNEGVHIGLLDGSVSWRPLNPSTRELLTKYFGINFSDEQTPGTEAETTSETSSETPASNKPMAQSALIVIPGVGMGSVKFGMSKDDVIKQLGKPDLVHGGNLIYASRGFDVFIKGERGLTLINCCARSVYDNSLVERLATDFTGATNKGIRLGSSEKQIIQAYGEPTSRSVDGADVELRYKTPGLYFKLTNDKLINFKAMLILL